MEDTHAQLDQTSHGSELPAMGEDSARGYALGDEELQQFNELITEFPISVQEDYTRRLQENQKRDNEVSRFTTFFGLMYELQQISSLMSSGLEQIDFTAPATIGSVTYLGYSKRADLSGEPDTELTSSVDCDVPISRDGIPYIYEVKSGSRGVYGSDRVMRNQLLKYQQAINNGQVVGATVKLKGRIDGEFLSWVIGNSGEPSHIPDVEILYTFDLPSGEEHTITIKPGSAEGIHIPPTPLEDSEDECIGRGITVAILDGSLASIISLDNYMDLAPDNLRTFVENPSTITTLAQYQRYIDMYQKLTYQILIAKAKEQEIQTA